MTINKDVKNQGSSFAKGAAISAVIATPVAPALVASLGFKNQGIAAGSMAASMMATEAAAAGDRIAAGGLVATLQSVGVVGFGTAANVGIAIVGALIGLALTWFAFDFMVGAIASRKKQKASNKPNLKENVAKLKKK